MAPLITDPKELIFTVKKGNLKLRYQELKVRTNSDFIVTQGTGKRDLISFASGTGGGIAINTFYGGASTIKDFTLGGNLFVQSSKDQKVAVIHEV